MADISLNTGIRGRGSKPRTRKMQTRIDMTPMVDLGFLLITFFILTTSLLKNNAFQLAVPSNNGKAPVRDSVAITIVMDKDNGLYYYFGARDEKGNDPKLIKTNYGINGLRQMLLSRNSYFINNLNYLNRQVQLGQLTEKDFNRQLAKLKEQQLGPVVIIKSTDEATYNNMVDVLDEMRICNICRYALVDITDFDRDLLKKYKPI